MNSLSLPEPNSPLAVVGMACRFPRGLEDLQTLWSSLQTKFSAIDTVPAERWTAERYYSSQERAKGKAYIRRGGFLTHDVSRFDAAFFGISPRDAENMDPQQRLLLEVVWEAFENAGLILPNHAGRAVGVYVGGFMLDHMITQMTPSNRSQINQHTAAGMMMTMLSNRVSHTFDFRGPSLSIDTACSSSLVAFHYACQDLWRGAAELAVVGGSNVILRPEYPMGMCKGHFLSRDGECKSFDARGDGYGRGEGAAAVLLKPLAAALAAGDPILATVVATGTNQDGRTPGISMPNFVAQKELIDAVCAKYDIDPSAVRYVECHGTGTAVGDPIEARAIGETYGKARRGRGPVVIGSIKSNIGHLEAAAGVAGIIKAVLTAGHRRATPLANLQTPNPAIDFDELNVRLADDLIELGNDDSPFYVAVNSFGYGGSNAHVILHTPPTAPAIPDPSASSLSQPAVTASSGNGNAEREFPYFLPISGRHPQAIHELAGKYAAWLRAGHSLTDLLHTAACHRAHLSQRAVVIAHSEEDLLAQTEALARQEQTEQVVMDSEPFVGSRRPVFVFTGMGPQWWGMGQELYREQAVYRRAVEEADGVFRAVSGFSILAEMLKAEANSQIGKTVYAQPANLVIQIGLLAVLRAAGVHPGAVVGHSVGELASAYAAGVLSLADVMQVCYHRSQLQATCAGMGAMMAVGLNLEQTREILMGCEGQVSIAAINGPANITLAGDRAFLNEIAARLKRADVFHRFLEVEVPYHSPMMDPIMAPLERALANVQPQLPQLPLYSTVTGVRVEGLAYGAEYWPQNIRQPVSFAPAIQAILQDGYNTFLEVGPHPVLATSLKECIKAAGKDCRTIHTLRRNQPELLNVYRGAMGVHAAGCEIDWNVHNGLGKLAPIGNYAWQREKYWVENERAMQDRIAPIVHPMLGIQEAPGTPAWRNDFDHEPVAYLREHVVSGMPVLPAAGYVESMLELASIQLPEAGGYSLRDFAIYAPMLITVERGLDCVTSYDAATQAVTIRGLENGKLGIGMIHATATLGHAPAQSGRAENLAQVREMCTESWEISAFYQDLQRLGLSYGPLFQTVRELWVSPDRDRGLARISIADELRESPYGYVLHPTVLDACFQSLVALLQDTEQVYLPTGFAELCTYQAQVPADLHCLTHVLSRSDREVICNLTLVDSEGTVVAAIREMQLSSSGKRERVDQFGDRVKQQILQYEWSYGELLNEPKRLGHWLVVGSHAQIAAGVCERLENFGAQVVGRVRYGKSLQLSHGEIVVRPTDLSDLQAALAHCGELDGVVYLSGLHATVDSDDPTGEEAVAALATLTQALLRTEHSGRPRVYVVTQQAFAVQDGDTVAHPGQSALNGFVRVAVNELDGWQFTSVDVPHNCQDLDLDTLVLELLCDDVHDEIAIRHGLRLVSILAESTQLSVDRIKYGPLSDDEPLLVRPLRTDHESVGTARLLSAPVSSLGPHDVRLRVEAMRVPNQLLMEPQSDTMDAVPVEVVGEILELGADVQDWIPGMRVCGFVPPDVASQVVGPRDLLQLTTLPTNADAGPLLSSLSLTVRALAVLDELKVFGGERALVEETDLGRVIADHLSRRGVQVVMLRAEDRMGEGAEGDSLTACELHPESLYAAVSRCTAGQGFDYLIVGVARWLIRADFRSVRRGGVIVDLDPAGNAFRLPAHVRSVVRSGLGDLLQMGPALSEILRRAVEQLTTGTAASQPYLAITLADLAWRKLPLADSRSTLVLKFDSLGQDLPIVERDDLRFRSDATYLITGGFGGLGLRTAEWLIQHGARSLVLTGRTGADTPERQQAVRDLERAGARVLAVACDTADGPRVAQLIADIQATMPPLKGVFHSGAVIQDQPITEVDLGTLATVMKSKALGAWNLHQATRNYELDHFVMYSSLANLVGNSRQAAYSAANGYLNGLAHYRRGQALVGTAVNWGAIADVGVVARDEKLEQFLRYTGLRGLNSREGLQILRTAMGRGVPQFGVTNITSWADWARFETVGARSPRFAALIAADSQGQDSSLRAELIAELSQMAPADQVELLAGLIVELVASVLKSDPTQVPVDKAINLLGVDSLMATEIQLLLDTKLGVKVSILELIGDATIRSLANHSVNALMGA